MMFKRIDHVEIVPADFERSLRFYTEQLGFRLASRHAVNAPPISEVAYLTLNESAIELLHADAPSASNERIAAGYRAMAWEVDDMQATLRDLEGKGIPTTWGPRTNEAYVRAEIADPDGNSIELRQWFKRP
jgi:glyoxylase I family protein